MPASRDQVLRYRARVMHLDQKLTAGSFAVAARGGLQDSAPLLPYDDAYTKLDRELLVPDPELRARVLPLVGQSTLGHTPGAILVDGEIVGSWQRQQRKVTLHPWAKLSSAVRDAIEEDALTFPIAGSSRPSVAWG